MDCESTGIIERTVGVAAGGRQVGGRDAPRCLACARLDDRHCELRVLARNTIIPTYRRITARFEHKALVVLQYYLVSTAQTTRARQARLHSKQHLDALTAALAAPTTYTTPIRRETQSLLLS